MTLQHAAPLRPDPAGVPEPVTVTRGETAIGAIPAKPYRVDVTPDRDFVSINLGLVRSNQALGGDRIRPKLKRPGMMRFHPAGARTYCHGEVNDGELFLFWLDRDARMEMADEMGDRALREIDGVQEDLHSPTVIQVAQLARRFALGTALGGAMAAEALSVVALSEAMRLVTEQNREPREETPLVGSRLAVALDLVEERLEEDIGLLELARAVDMSPSRLTRAFKAATGLPPHQYLMERRVARARSLLADGHASLADVAYAAGFASQAHMTTVFKRRLGTTPGRLRRTH